jgi:hypothetical protein
MQHPPKKVRMSRLHHRRRVDVHVVGEPTHGA